MPAGSGHSWACRHAVSSTCSCRAGGCTPGGRHNHNLWLQLRVPDRALPLDPASFKQTTLGVVHGTLSWPSCRHHTSGMHETRLQTDHQLPGASPCCASSCLGSSPSSSQRKLPASGAGAACAGQRQQLSAPVNPHSLGKRPLPSAHREHSHGLSRQSPCAALQGNRRWAASPPRGWQDYS